MAGKNDFLTDLMKTSFEYISNTDRLRSKGEVFHPNNFRETTGGEKTDKIMKYDMNMSYGNSPENAIKYFDRLYSIYPEIELEGTCQYIFLVRPDLNLYQSGGDKLVDIQGSKKSNYHASSAPAKDTFFQYMHKNYPTILKQLTSEFDSSHDFIPYLVGRAESLQLPDFGLKDYSISQPYSGLTLPYAGHGFESMTGGNFDITFREDNNLRVLKFFQAWVYYIHNIMINKFEPKEKHIPMNRIDYATSVYCITCRADAKTILHWAKYTGAFPLTVPNSDWSFNLRGNSAPFKLTIPFKYFYTDPIIDPIVLVDFNKNAHVVDTKQTYVPLYNNSKTLKGAGFKDTRTRKEKSDDQSVGISLNYATHEVLGTGNGLVGSPFIYRNTSRNIYELRWKKIDRDISF